ncbi:MAG: hypothetical protein FVQ80_00945 [Planctomycetes bacterium]|nr:hypothetical protein [Planctomycetota bacterium]
MNTNKVCGEFPEFCYRAFECKEYAEDFMDRGTFRMGCQLGYKTMENEARCDPTEGSGLIKVLAIVTSYSFSNDSTEEPICSQEMGYREESSKQCNPKFCFCTSLPEVDRNHMKTFGKYIVKINNPRKLAEDINDYFTNNEEGKFLIVGCYITYNKGQKVDRPHLKNEILDMSYKQKPESFSDDREFRIVALKLSESCIDECKFLSGTDELKCIRKTVNLEKPLNDIVSFV